METRERRTLYLPTHVDQRIVELAAQRGHSFATQARAMLIDSIEQRRTNGSAGRSDLARLDERIDHLETLQRELLRTLRVRGKLELQLLAGLRAVLQELAEGSIDPAHRAAWLQKLDARRNAEMEAILVELEARLEDGR
ncbi:MAG: hypothetical protein AAFX81_16740 [Pseudomonadota bacterium]